MILLSDYWMGRDVKYASAMTPEIGRNAEKTVFLANSLLAEFGQRRTVTSGWRPPELNAKTVGAAVNSKHMLALAIDLADPEGDLDDWLMDTKGQAVITRIGLWMEHPAATKGWSHLQTIPPKSGKRVFYP